MSKKMARKDVRFRPGEPLRLLRRYLLFFRAVLRLEDFLLVAFFFGLAAVFFLVAAFLAGAFFAVAFLAAFLAAGAWRLRAGVVRLALAAGTAGGSSMGTGDGVAVFGCCIPDEDAAPAATGIAIAGSLMASSQPGVNISRRSREMALARPQRGQCAS